MAHPIEQELRGKKINKAKMLVIGNFAEGDIIINRGAGRIPANEVLVRQSEERFNPRWTPGPLVRLEGFELKDNRLILHTGETNFKEYVGSRDPSSLIKFGVTALSNPISTSSVIITSDVKIIIADKSTGDAAGSIDAPGGYMHPTKDINSRTNTLDPFLTAIREVGEEVFVGKKEITPEELEQTRALIIDPVCTGLSYEYAGLCHPVLSFAMRIPITAAELDQRIQQINQIPNHEIKVQIVEPFKLENSSYEYIMTLLADRYPQIEPDGRVSIALARLFISNRSFSMRVVRQLLEV